MTETTSLVSLAHITSAANAWPPERRLAGAGGQGLLVPGLEQRLVDDQGRDLPWDGQAVSQLLLRGPWIASQYQVDARSAETFRLATWLASTPRAT